MTRHVRMLPVFLVAVVALILGVAALELRANNEEVIEFDEAEIFLEFNSTDKDLGVQIFFDAEGWEQVEVSGPHGTIFEVENNGGLKEIGSTEVFTESEEPELDPEDLEGSIAEFLALFPEGTYFFEGETIEGDELLGEAELTHDLPAAVSVDLDDFPTIRWIDNSEQGDPEIVGYQVITELVVEASEERVFVFSIDLLGDADMVMVPLEFVELVDEFDEEEIEEFKVEVIAIEGSGNKTITEESLLEDEEE